MTRRRKLTDILSKTLLATFTSFLVLLSVIFSCFFFSAVSRADDSANRIALPFTFVQS